jgi:hypothetical protein
MDREIERDSAVVGLKATSDISLSLSLSLSPFSFTCPRAHHWQRATKKGRIKFAEKVKNLSCFDA